LNKDKIKELKSDLRRARNELNTFYEITQAMRGTLKFDEILYIILTGMTSHHGLGYNRAVLFSLDYQKKTIRAIMGIGPFDAAEAGEIWKWIEKEKKSLEDLIKEYRWIKDGSKKSRFFEFVKTLEIPYVPKIGSIYKAFNQGRMICLRKKDIADTEKDWLYRTFHFEECVLVPLLAKNRVAGVLFVDNFITKKKINRENLRILEMFASQASLALENSKLFEGILSKAHTDSLTGLWNYGYFQYKVDEEIASCRQNDSAFSLFMIDIDNFKEYNDTFGHLEGDAALIQTGKIIKDNCRREDVVCRYGGEEFVVILPGISQEDAIMTAERIRESFLAQDLLFKSRITVSIGVSFFPLDSAEKKSLINKADRCLYKAKHSGKNTVINL
jgi:diguanylate cyclase (GGDEF)-like protein